MAESNRPSRNDADGITDLEAEKALGDILGSSEFAGSHQRRSVLQALFKARPSCAVCRRDLVKDLGWEPTDDRIGPLVRSVREKLSEYHDKRPGCEIVVRFPMSQGHGGPDAKPYRLSFERNAPTEEYIRLLFKNRSGGWFEKILLAESDDILFVGIGSQFAFKRAQAWFRQGAIRAKHFRVLTWWPSQEAARALADNTGDDPEDLYKCCIEAWGNWKELEARHPNVLEAYRYGSMPTMSAIANETDLAIELLPFNRAGRAFHESGTHENRPGLRLKRPDASFHLFRNAFEDLWLASLLGGADDAHPHWVPSRIERLREAGLLPTSA